MCSAPAKSPPPDSTSPKITAEVYGGDHSPWVQAVLLGLREKAIPYTLRSTPTAGTFFKWGVIMPTMSLNGGPWRRESFELLASLGFKPLNEEESAAIRAAWQGVIHRSDNLLRFLHAFALAGESSPKFVERSCRNLFRGFIALYMMTLMGFVRLLGKMKDPENFGDQFLYWEQAIADSDGDFIDGDSPGGRDLLLFGIVQCHASIPVPPLEALRFDERLEGVRGWIMRMQQRFQDVGHLYSGQYFSPSIEPPETASEFQQAMFYLGFIAVILALPLTLPLILLLIFRTTR